MKAYISATGKTRMATFTVDTDKRTFHRDTGKVFPVTADTPKVGDEYRIESRISDDDGYSLQGDCWIVLAGTKAAILESMLEECPMSLMHSEGVLSELDKREDDDWVIITFAGMKPFNRIIYKSPEYRLMRSCQRSIVGSLYGVDPKSVILVPDTPYPD